MRLLGPIADRGYLPGGFAIPRCMEDRHQQRPSRCMVRGSDTGAEQLWCGLETQAARGRRLLVGHDAAAPLALQLIAMLDPKDEAWPVVPDALPIASSQHPTLAALAISSSCGPLDGQRVVLTRATPHEADSNCWLEALHRGEADRNCGGSWTDS